MGCHGSLRPALFLYVFVAVSQKRGIQWQYHGIWWQYNIDRIRIDTQRRPVHGNVASKIDGQQCEIGGYPKGRLAAKQCAFNPSRENLPWVPGISRVGAPHSEDVGSAVSNVIDDYRPRNLVWEGGTHGYGHWPLPLIGRKGLRRLDFCWDARFSGCYILDFGCVFTAKKWYTEHMEISRL